MKYLSEMSMSISFKEYVVLLDLLKEAAKDDDKNDILSKENMRMYFALAAKTLGPNASDEDKKEFVKKYIDKLKKKQDELDAAEKKKSNVTSSVAGTKASKDFYARQAERIAKGPIKTKPTINHTSDRARMRSGDFEWNRQFESKQLDEAKEFEVTYKLRDGDKIMKWKTNGRDSAHVKKLFNDAHYGAKLLTIKPMKVKTA